MKRISILTLALVGLSAATMFTSCSEDEVKPKPSITVESPTDGGTVVSGAAYVIKFNASTNAELKSILVKVKNGSAESTILDTTFASGKNAFDFNDTRIAGAAGTETITITATDRDNVTDTKTLTLTVSPSAGEINSYSARLLGGQSNQTEGSFYASTTNTIYNQANAKTNATAVDFLYYYGASNNASIAAPNDGDAGTIYNNSTTGLQTWSKRNATKFAETTLTATQFDAITDDGAIVAATSNASATTQTKLAGGQVFAFKTEAGKSGLVKVVTITGTQTGSILIDVKVQK